MYILYHIYIIYLYHIYIYIYIHNICEHTGFFKKQPTSYMLSNHTWSPGAPLINVVAQCMPASEPKRLFFEGLSKQSAVTTLNWGKGGMQVSQWLWQDGCFLWRTRYHVYQSCHNQTYWMKPFRREIVARQTSSATTPAWKTAGAGEHPSIGSGAESMASMARRWSQGPAKVIENPAASSLLVRFIIHIYILFICLFFYLFIYKKP